MPVTGGGVVAENITKFGGGFAKHVQKVMQEVVDALDIEITKNISLTDHTQDELTDLDHPYAKRHGSIGKPIHEPYWQIHTQSGLLISSKKKGVSDVGIVGTNLKVTGWVALDDTIASYAIALIWGTSVMIPRDALSGSLFDEAFKNHAQETLKTNLRDMVVNFKGVETR